MESFPYITLPRRKYCAKKVQLRFFAEMPNFAILSISDEKDFAILSIFDKKNFANPKKWYLCTVETKNI